MPETQNASTAAAPPSDEDGLLISSAWLVLGVSLVAAIAVWSAMATTGPSYAREIDWYGVGIGVGLVLHGIVVFALLSGIAALVRHAAAIRHAIAPASLTAAVQGAPLPPGAVGRCQRCGTPLTEKEAYGVKGEFWCADHFRAS